MIQTVTTAIMDALASLLANDTATLNAVARPKLMLAKAPFVPGVLPDPAALTEADFDGYAAMAMGAGVPVAFAEPGSGDRLVETVEPLGGWHFQTTGVTNLPETIYGWGLVNNAKTVLYDSALLDAPITLTAAGQGFDVPNVRVRLPLAAFLGQAP